MTPVYSRITWNYKGKPPMYKGVELAISRQTIQLTERGFWYGSEWCDRGGRPLDAAPPSP